jgi:IclR family transcriptional regulator, KDG regulon repressor
MSIQSVDRALKILTLFSHRHPALGVTEISQALGLSKGTVHGLIRTLLRQGFLQQDLPSRRYRLGLKIYELGIILAGSMEINQKAAGPINQLAKTTGLVCRLSIWDGDSMVITSDASPRPRAVLPYQFGPRVHAYCSAMGKAVLAFLDPKELKNYLDRTQLSAFTTSTITQKEALVAELEDTRKRGYAVDREEAVPGMVCLGAPVFHREGHVAGAISVSGSVARMLGDKMDGIAEELMKTAAEISRYMGHMPAFSGNVGAMGAN